MTVLRLRDAAFAAIALRLSSLLPAFAAALTVLCCGLLLSACRGGIDARLENAEQLLQEGKASEAIELLREALAEQPDHPGANYLLGVSYVQTSQTSLAIWPLEKAAATEEYGVTAGLVLAATFLATQQYDAAIRAATRVLEREPERTAALHTRARAYIGASQPERALEDADFLLEFEPDDYNALLLRAAALADLGELDATEETHLRIREVAALDSPQVGARGCLALADFYHKGRRDTDRAREVFLECLEEYPTEPLALRLASAFFDATEEPARALGLWEHALELQPDNLSVRAELATRLAAADRAEEGETLLEAATEEWDSADAWLQLANFRRLRGDIGGATAALVRATEVAPPSAREQLLSHRVDLLIDEGDLDDAEALIAQLERPEYREIARGRLLLERGDAENALAALEAGIERWPNNPGARFLAGRAALEAGNEKKAAAHLREATRADGAATDAALLLAQIYLSQGRYSDAATMSQRHASSRPLDQPAALLVHVRATSQLGEYDAARSTLDNLEGREGRTGRSVAERAEVERLAEGPAAAVRTIEESGLDLQQAESSLALRALAENLIALGRTEEALTHAQAAAAADPDSAELQALHGQVLLRAGRRADAKAAFEHALERDPEFAPALAGRGYLAAAEGDPNAAVEWFDRATTSNPVDQSAAYAAAQLVLGEGRTDEAERRLREVLDRDPGNALAANDLAWILAERGAELDYALALAERAVRIAPTAEVRDTLGWVQLKAGRPDAALLSFRDALEENPASATIWYHLGLAQAEKGSESDALESFRTALSKSPFPFADDARARIARLERQ